MRAVILDGIVLGLQFGLLGVGLTLVYGLGGVLNLAHGQIAVAAAIAIALLIDSGMTLLFAVILGLCLAGAIGLFLDLTVLRPVYREHGEHRVLLGLLLMLGVAFVIDGYLTWRHPIDALRIRVEGPPIEVFGVRMRRGSLVGAGVAFAVGTALALYLRLLPAGKAVRSVIQDEEGAQLCGVNPVFVRRLIFALSAVLAGLVAVTRSMTAPVTVNAGIELTILALIVAVVGGLGSVAGAFLAGMLLGVVNSVSSFYIGTYVTTIMLLAAAAVTIVARPSGLLGRPP